MRDPLFLAQLGFVAITVGIVAAVVLHMTARDPRFPMTVLLLSIGAVPAIIGAARATGVHLDLAVVWFGRLSNLLLLVALGVAILQSRTNRVTSLPRGRDLLLAALAFSLMAMLSEFATGRVGSRSWVPVAGFVATWLAVSHPEWLLTQAKRVTGVYVIGSAAASAVAPYASVAYGASLIGLGERFQGLFHHPNSLGPPMLLYLILEYAQPSTRWVRWSVGTTAAAMLLLSQSKTAWAAGVIVAVILWAGRAERTVGVRVAAIAFMAVAVVSLVSLTDDVAEYEITQVEGLGNVRTLTGRTEVWQYGIQAWRSSPLFGQGGQVFRDYASRTAQPWAGQAHNQFVQTAARHGAVGLVGLLFYVGVMVRHGFRHGPRTRYASLALVGMILTTMVAESSLEGFEFEMFIVFALLAAWERTGSTDPADMRIGDEQPASWG